MSVKFRKSKVSLLFTCVNLFLLSSLAYGNLCKKIFMEKDNDHWVESQNLENSSLKGKTVRITVKGGSTISGNSIVQLNPNDVIEGKVIDSRLPLGIEIQQENSNTILVTKMDIVKLHIKAEHSPETIQSFREKYNGKDFIEFEPPFGPKNGLRSMPSLTGKKVAIFIQDSKNFNLGETIVGEITDGLPNSPEYTILKADGTTRNIMYLYVHEIRILSE